MELGAEADVDTAMVGIYQRALKETGYKATRFLDILHEHRGLRTARMLIQCRMAIPRSGNATVST